jgi:chitin synthase
MCCVDGEVSPLVSLNSANTTDVNAVYHDFRAFTTDPRAYWYFEKMAQMCYTSRKGSVGFTPKEVKELAENGQSLVVYNGLIYDVTSCITTPPATATPEGTMAPPGTATQFLDEAVVDLFLTYAGTDITKLDSLPINCLVLGRQKISLRNLYTIGGVDNRNSAWCLFSTYILLVLPIIMVSIIGFKFFASINLDQSGHQRTTRSS